MSVARQVSASLGSCPTHRPGRLNLLQPASCSAFLLIMPWHCFLSWLSIIPKPSLVLLDRSADRCWGYRWKFRNITWSTDSFFLLLLCLASDIRESHFQAVWQWVRRRCVLKGVCVWKIGMGASSGLNGGRFLVWIWRKKASKWGVL